MSEPIQPTTPAAPPAPPPAVAAPAPPPPMVLEGAAAIEAGLPVEAMKTRLAALFPNAVARTAENQRLAAERSARFLALLKERFGVDPDAVNHPLVPRAHHFALAQALRDELGYSQYVTVCASHWLAAKTKTGDDPEHFEVATVLRSVGAGSHHAAWRVRLELGEDLDSLVPLFAGADWQEREQFDLVGVTFKGHPDLRRLMMPDEWEGHPLRKDYAIDTRCAPWR